jgi:hypothetical protein
MTSKTVRVQIVRTDSACFIPVPFDPKEAFGKVRAPVRVTLHGYTYRSTIAVMGGCVCIPLRRSHREAAGLEGNETIGVEIALDTTKRVVAVPRDLATALKDAPPAWERWRELSYSHQREYVEAIVEARKPETRDRRIRDAVRTIGVLRPKPRARRGA